MTKDDLKNGMMLRTWWASGAYDIEIISVEPWKFVWRKVATLIEKDAVGKEDYAISISEFLNHKPEIIGMGSSSSCATCQEPFLYGAPASNRPDGKTDCYRCKTMKGVFT